MLIVAVVVVVVVVVVGGGGGGGGGGGALRPFSPLGYKIRQDKVKIYCSEKGKFALKIT